MPTVDPPVDPPKSAEAKHLPVVPPPRVATFSVPKATLREPYRARIEGRVDRTPVVVVAAMAPNETGITFDPATGELFGTPGAEGAFRIAVQWHDGTALRSGEAALMIQPPPKPRVASFKVANAKAGEPYRAKIEATAEGAPVAVVTAVVPPACGLAFDSASGELHGTPAADGEFLVALQWQDGATVRAGEVALFVNASPRSLWKNLESDKADPYFKPDEDACCLAVPGFRIVAASKRGRSHAHVGSFRDDDFFVEHDPASGWSVLIAADGAGSAPSSRRGSQLAVATAGGHLMTALKGSSGAEALRALAGWDADASASLKALYTAFFYLFQRAAVESVQAIQAEAEAKAKPARDYATTLLAAAVHRDGGNTFLATFWMGDGAMAAYGPRGVVRLMGSPDSGEFAGQTRFLDRGALTSADFGKRISIGRYAGLDAVILATDGISDPFFETDNGLADAARWDQLWDAIAPALASGAPEASLLDWLDFLIPGHHDDRTLVVLW